MYILRFDVILFWSFYYLWARLFYRFKPSNKKHRGNVESHAAKIYVQSQVFAGNFFGVSHVWIRWCALGVFFLGECFWYIQLFNFAFFFFLENGRIHVCSSLEFSSRVVIHLQRNYSMLEVERLKFLNLVLVFRVCKWVRYIRKLINEA